MSLPATEARALDCRTCAACCAAEVPSPMYVGLTPLDEARLDPRFRARHVARGALLTRLDPSGRCVCVALRGTVGRRGSCAIYERRPDECRRLEPGSADCLRARTQAGIE
jgi:Fe-S-cluster containining protein